jgi:hypothetical protein
MLDQVEDLLRAGIWLGPSVLGALFYRLVGDPNYAAADDVAGVVMLILGAIALAVAGVRFNKGQGQLIVPAAFVAMFVVSWTMR